MSRITRADIDERPGNKVVALLVLGVFLLVLGAGVVDAFFEARAYNNATGSDVSTWDAMWIELRVQAGPR